MLKEMKKSQGIKFDFKSKKHHFKIYRVEDFNLPFLEKLVKFEQEQFSDAGMDEWGIVPQIRHGRIYVLKTEDDPKIYGIAIFMRDWENPAKCYLYDYGITSKFRGKGLGTKFLRQLVKIMAGNGFEKMSLTVDIKNTPAVKVYKEKLGFRIIDILEEEYGKGEDRYYMELDLPDNL